MSPSLFNNEYSRGPLYRYWKDRGEEEKSLREQRVQEAKLRSKGIQPISPTFGPSSNDQYASRATSGPPVYVCRPHMRNDNDSHNNDNDNDNYKVQVPAHPEPHPEPESLPPYDTATGPRAHQQQHHHSSSSPSTQQDLSAEELPEKARLRQLEDQRRQIVDDAAIAEILSSDQAGEHPSVAPTDTITNTITNTDTNEPEPDNHAKAKWKGKGKEKEKKPDQQRRKSSTAGKIGSWLADAASGYTKKQGRW